MQNASKTKCMQEVYHPIRAGLRLWGKNDGRHSHKLCNAPIGTIQSGHQSNLFTFHDKQNLCGKKGDGAPLDLEGFADFVHLCPVLFQFHPYGWLKQHENSWHQPSGDHLLHLCFDFHKTPMPILCVVSGQKEKNIISYFLNI